MSDPLERSDEELVEDYLAGDVAAFRTIVERHHDLLFRFLYRLVGTREMAEDVFQETFLQIHESLEGFDTSRRFKPWLFTIAANKGRDALRRASRRGALSLSARNADDEGDALVDLLEVDLPGPDRPLEQQEQNEMVQRALDTLSPRLREILLLCYFQRLSYLQIAEQLSIPVGTVKSRLHAAVAAFARAWQSQMAAREPSKRNATGREHT